MRPHQLPRASVAFNVVPEAQLAAVEVIEAIRYVVGPCPRKVLALHGLAWSWRRGESPGCGRGPACPRRRVVGEPGRDRSFSRAGISSRLRLPINARGNRHQDPVSVPARPKARWPLAPLAAILAASRLRMPQGDRKRSAHAREPCGRPIDRD